MNWQGYKKASLAGNDLFPCTNFMAFYKTGRNISTRFLKFRF
jgi:hypothetical protein